VHADQDRSADVVIDDLFAAIAARDWAAVACQYHPDASMIDDQGLLIGRAATTHGLIHFNGPPPE
jgi:hypothetical protein